MQKIVEITDLGDGTSRIKLEDGTEHVIPSKMSTMTLEYAPVNGD